MSALKVILVSLHGRRVGLSALGELIVNGLRALLANDQGVVISPMGAPTAKTVTATLTAAELLTRYLTGSHTAGATQTYTLPTGTLLEAAIQAAPELAKLFQTNHGFEWEVINISAAALDTITIAAGTDHTLVGAALIPSNHVTTGGLDGTSTARFRTRRTASGVFVTYRA